jgi:hypothetical protein
MGWYYPGRNTTIATQYRGNYTYRKKFNVTNASSIVSATLSLFEDDGADVYINNVRVYRNYGSQTYSGAYWNSETAISTSVFVTGENIIAVRQYHTNHRSPYDRMGFDLQLSANTKGNMTGTQRKNIVVMTDGQANVRCDEQDTGSAIQDAIKAACDAYTKYGVITYTVGFGRDADATTLQSMANCTTGQYYAAANATQLRAVFNSIAGTIIQQSGTQTAITQGNVSRTILYSDSSIRADYAAAVPPPQPNELSVTLQSPQLSGCDANAQLDSGMRFVDAAVTSYSGEYWTDRLVMNSTAVYNLSYYSTLYDSLGDPYMISVPASLLQPGANSISTRLGIDPSNLSVDCSPNNTLIYTVAVNLSVERSDAVPNSAGCKWIIEFPDNTTANLTIPTTYVGSNSCSYRPGNITYDASDAYQLGAYMMFHRLDFNKDGTVFVNLREEDLEVIVTTISRVPYLWGPSIVTLEVVR